MDLNRLRPHLQQLENSAAARWLRVHRTGAFVLIAVGYSLIQLLLLVTLRQQQAFAFGVVPLLLSALLLDRRSTLLMGGVLLVVQPLCMLPALGSLTLANFLAGSAVTLVMTAIAIVFCHMARLTRTVRSQLARMQAAEKEKTELLARLHQAEKMEALGQLAGGIAHDFNNMLGAISGYAEMIKIGFGTQNPALAKYATGIYNAAQRAADMTTNLLTFARKGRFEPHAVDLNAMVAHLVDLLAHTIDKRITIEQNLSAASAVVMGDATQLHNSLLNLALNARDAMPEGGTLRFVSSLAQVDAEFICQRPFEIQPGRYLLLSVQDSGTGMDAATRARAMEPFFTTKPQGRGTGLGLSIVFGAVKAHGGFIELHSAPGQGTRVDLYLPLARGEAASSPPLEATPATGSGHILVIDDEQLVAEMAEAMLMKLGYSVRVCLDAREGIAYYREDPSRTDLVLLDLMMPAMSGQECYAELTSIDPDVKVVFASGYAPDGTIEAIMTAGTTGFLRKPFTATSLAEALRSSLGRGGQDSAG